MVKIRRLLHDYSLAWILGSAFLLSWLGQYFTHEGAFVDFANATLENWQSEFLQLATQVALTAYAIYRGSPVSRDSSDRMQADLDHLRQQADRIEAALARLAEQNVNKPGK